MKNKKHKGSEKYREKRKARKFDKEKDDENNDYGLFADEVDDVETIWKECINFYEDRILSDVKIASSIETSTQDQADCQNWYYHRMKRLTASHFADICRTQKDSRRINLVKELIYKTEKRFIPKPIQYGKDNEPTAIASYSLSQDVFIYKSGLRISFDNPFLGCSPDGVILDDNLDIRKIIEVKCPYTLKNSTLEEIKARKDFEMKYDSNEDKWSLKKTSEYYYQVQGQLSITKLEECDFIVSTPENNLIIDKLKRNDELWNRNMLPRLKSFFFRFYLPELVLRRAEEDRPLFVFEEEYYNSVIVPYIDAKSIL